MPRPTAAAVLLALAAVARATGIGLSLARSDGPVDPVVAVVALEVLVPLVLAVADTRRAASAATGALVLAGLGTGQLMSVGVETLQAGSLPSDLSRGAMLLAAGLATAAGAAVIGRWQDVGAPGAPTPLPHRTLRALVVLAAAVTAVGLLRTETAVLGAVTTEVGVLPGPVAVASSLGLARIPLLLGALAPIAWSVARTSTVHVGAAAAVLGARGVVETTADWPLVVVGLPLWPVLLTGAASAVLLAALPLARRTARRGQTSSSIA